MALTTTPWDVQDHIGTPERQLAYLEAAFEDGDPTLIAAAIGDVARARGMSEVAANAGVTRERLSTTMRSDGDPRLSTLVGVLRALGFTLSVTTAPAR